MKRERIAICVVVLAGWVLLWCISFSFLVGCDSEYQKARIGGLCIYYPYGIARGIFSSAVPNQAELTASLCFSAIIAALCILGFSRDKGKVVPIGGGVFGTADWCSVSDIQKAGFLNDKGVFLGKLGDGRYLRHEGPEHYAVIAPTRSGKGAGVVVPTLLSWRGSTIVYDLKEENFRITSGFRSTFSDVIYFNPASLNTSRFNPLDEVRRGEYDVRDAQNLANIIVEPDKQSGFDHWSRTSNSLLTAAILHVVYAFPPERRNLRGVAELLSNPAKSITETLYEMLETKHINGESVHPGIAGTARDVLNKSPDDKSSVISTVMGYLAIYRDPILSHALSVSDFSVNGLVNSERAKSLYFVISPADIDRLRPVIRMMVNLVCRRLTESLVEGGNKHKLLLMLDEFPALGRLEFFETALGYLAGYGIKAMLIAQSLNQLRQVYGEKTAILDNTHVQVFYAPNTLETAQYISKTLGEMSVNYRTTSRSSSHTKLFDGSVSDSISVGTRSLLTPREVLEFPKDEAIIFAGSVRPIRAKKIRYFEDSNFSKRVLAPAVLQSRADVQMSESIRSNVGDSGSAVIVTDESSTEEEVVC
jgi:type IV secretion system protein VirD4